MKTISGCDLAHSRSTIFHIRAIREASPTVRLLFHDYRSSAFRWNYIVRSKDRIPLAVDLKTLLNDDP